MFLATKKLEILVVKMTIEGVIEENNLYDNLLFC